MQLKYGFSAALVCAVGLTALRIVAHAQDEPFIANPPVQSEVAASKVTFASVPSTDPQVKTALTPYDTKAALDQVGKPASFVGKVTVVFVAPKNRNVILNFDKDYTKTINAVLIPPYYDKFPDLRILDKKKVLISGVIYNYKGRPEIFLKDPAQIKVIP